MVRVLERYEQQSNPQMEFIGVNHQSQESWTLGREKLKSRIDLLQQNQRNLMGEDIDSLSLKELLNLEQQLDTSLRRFRTKKSQLMLKSISELEKKDKTLKDQNNLLIKEVKGKEKEPAQPSLMGPQSYDNMGSCQLNLGEMYQPRDNEGTKEIQRQIQPSTVMPCWMIEYMRQ